MPTRAMCYRFFGGERAMVEKRHYAGYLIAEVTVRDATMKEARRQGFMKVRIPAEAAAGRRTTRCRCFLPQYNLATDSQRSA